MHTCLMSAPLKHFQDKNGRAQQTDTRILGREESDESTNAVETRAKR